MHLIVTFVYNLHIVKLQSLGLGLGVDFTFAGDNHNNNNPKNDNNPHLNIVKYGEILWKEQY